MPERENKSAALGFGCSALTGTSRRGANQVLAAAFDSGIRHFDVARYYGYGEAEGILGRFLEGRRSEVTITTKFGIEPPRRSTAFGFALAVGRQVVRRLPGARRILQRGAQALVKSSVFGVREAQLSLETSLRELRTDHIDFYLLHDYAVSDRSQDELLTFLEASVKSGKIGSFGIGTSFENVLQTLKQQPALCSVLQFQNSVLTRHLERLPKSTSHPIVITHGALGGSHRSILQFLQARRDVARNWAAKIGCEVCDEVALSALMLNFAAIANSNGWVLFSTRDPARVKKNVEALSGARFSLAQTATFGELVREESAAILPGGAEGRSDV